MINDMRLKAFGCGTVLAFLAVLALEPGFPNPERRSRAPGRIGQYLAVIALFDCLTGFGLALAASQEDDTPRHKRPVQAQELHESEQNLLRIRARLKYPLVRTGELLAIAIFPCGAMLAALPVDDLKYWREGPTFVFVFVIATLQAIVVVALWRLAKRNA